MDRPVTAAGTADILGQEQVISSLWSVLAEDRLHNCYLFQGMKGVGKFTVAIRFAMAANCEGDPGGPSPCGGCGSCTRIAAGRHPDVLEIIPAQDQATGIITVEQAREVVRVLSLHRHSARHRVVVVDPVDAMRAEATNALLKTLEDTPRNTTFILITSRTDMLLPTVRSRALQVRFKPVSIGPLEAWLERRGIGEARRLAGLSLGSPGLAVGLAAGRVGELVKARGKLEEAVSSHPGALLNYVEDLTKAPRESWEPKVDLALHALEVTMRDVVAVGSGAHVELLDPDAHGLASEWARLLWPGGVAAVGDALGVARQRLALNVNPRLVMEALLTRLARELRQ